MSAIKLGRNRFGDPHPAFLFDFFDDTEPLIFVPELLGIAPPANFEPTLFSDDELVSALFALNSQAAVGLQRVASRYLKSVCKDARVRVVLQGDAKRLQNPCPYF
jgi:hypothetical protein